MILLYVWQTYLERSAHSFQNLEKYPHSKLATIANKTIFDRPASLFQVVVDFLQTGQINADLSRVNATALVAEALFYQLPEMAEKVRQQELVNQGHPAVSTEQIIQTILQQQRNILDFGKELVKVDKHLERLVNLQVESKKDASSNDALSTEQIIGAILEQQKSFLDFNNHLKKMEKHLESLLRLQEESMTAKGAPATDCKSNNLFHEDIDYERSSNS